MHSIDKTTMTQLPEQKLAPLQLNMVTVVSHDLVTYSRHSYFRHEIVSGMPVHLLRVAHMEIALS